MTIDELKRALVEVSELCKKQEICGDCPFDKEYKWGCPISERPDQWDIDDWKEQQE